MNPTQPVHSSQSVQESQTTMEQDPAAAPFSQGFFSSDPAMRKSRIMYFKVMPLSVLLVVAVVIFGVLPIYWGSSYKAPEHIHNLHGWIVDLDGGELGQSVTQAFLNATGTSTFMTWSVDSTLRGDFDFEDAVVSEKTWMVITINANASSSLNRAIASADGTYNGSHAVTLWVNEARNQNAHRLLYQQVTAVLQSVDEKFAAKKASELASANNISDLLSAAPQTITSPLLYTSVNTRPFDVPIVTVVNFVGLIYLTIISFVTTMMSYNNIMVTTGLYPRLKFTHLLAIRLIYPFLAYFVLSAFYTLLSYAFGAPFTKWYGASGVVLYWMMCWCSMLALGLAIEAMITILTPRFIPFFLILWIVANVSSAFYPVPMLPGVFRYSYATPFYNLSRTVLTICFNTRNQMGLNFGVQVAWIAVSVCTITVFQWFTVRQTKKALVQRLPINEKEIV